MHEKSVILGIDTSCDETSMAILSQGKVLSNIVSSQVELHRPFGGVVPEMASRAHTEKIHAVLALALKEAGVTLGDLTGIAVTNSPGLIGCLLVGLSYAKALAYSLNIPLTAVHHLKGHLMSAFLEHDAIYPFLGLVVSGGHTSLYWVKDFNQITLVGTTVDDAAGEAYDKIAKILGLGYPGGPLVDKLARLGHSKAFEFTRAKVKKGPYYMSFSGLKTAVKQIAQKNELKDDLFVKNLCASFQEEVAQSLAEKVAMALENYASKALVLAGGVACNSRLREVLIELAHQKNIPICIPSPINCTDNAAMIAYVGTKQLEEGLVANLNLNAEASVPLALFYQDSKS